MIFCNVDDGLIDIIEKAAEDRVIVDCGCGVGLLAHKMRERKSDYSVVSVDMWVRYDPLIPDIIEMDVNDFPWTECMMPVFIRPCHGAGFTIRFQNLRAHAVKDFLYVSMPHNLEKDIELDNFHAEIIGDWIGDDGERVYKIMRRVA